MSNKVGINELLDAGVHFGHQTRKWNPQMKRYIFGERNGIHIIDLGKTLQQIDAVCNFLSSKVSAGGEILFVGTKKQAQVPIREVAQATNQLYITERWLGGALTNFNTVKKSINRLEKIEKMVETGKMRTFGKKEQASLRREAARIGKNLDGMRTMKTQPAAMFIVDLVREHNAVNEGRKLGIPIIGLTDTNSDPSLCDFAIPGNDDSIRSIRIILNAVGEAIGEARAKFKTVDPTPAAPAAAAPEAPSSEPQAGEEPPQAVPDVAPVGPATESTPATEAEPAPLPLDDLQPIGPTGPAAEAAAALADRSSSESDESQQ